MERFLQFLELLENGAVSRLRGVNLVDTVLIEDGSLVAWFYTTKDGVVAKASPHELNCSTLLLKLLTIQTGPTRLNPHGYVAMARYESGIVRPMKSNELESLLSSISGQDGGQRQQTSPLEDMPFCIQAFVPPAGDARHLTCWAEDSGALSTTCQTFVRRFGLRYTHAHDPAPLPKPMGHASHLQEMKDSSSVLPMSSEEMLVHSEMMATHMIEDTPLLSTAPMERSSPSVSPAHICAEAQKAIQNMVSFIERSYGLKAIGIIAEFVEAPPGGVLILVCIHAAQWDPRPSRGRLGTFTERWEDFLSGTGPAPSVRSGKGNALTPSTARETLTPRGSRFASGPSSPVYLSSPSASHTRTFSPKPISNTGAALVLEAEDLKETLQRQVDAELRAQAAIDQLTRKSKEIHSGLEQELIKLEAEVAEQKRIKEAAEESSSRLKSECEGLSTELGERNEKLNALKEELESERKALSRHIKKQQDADDRNETKTTSLRAEKSQLEAEVVKLKKKIEEGYEVIEAVKAQLVDYRNTVTSLQTQINKITQAQPVPIKKGMARESNTEARKIMLSSGTVPGRREISGILTRPAALNALIDSLEHEVSNDMHIISKEHSHAASPPSSSLATASPKRPSSRTTASRLSSTRPASKTVAASKAVTSGSSPKKAMLVHDPLPSSGDLTHHSSLSKDSHHERNPRAHEIWRPDYEYVSVADLCVSGGQILEEQVKYHDSVIEALKHMEDHLLEVFNFYARLKRATMVNNRLVMFEDQWLTLAREVGVIHEGFAREVHQLIADRKIIPGFTTGDAAHKCISFDQFPEAIARLAAVRYDYIVPDTNEEALNEVEMPDVLAEAIKVLPSRPKSSEGNGDGDHSSATYNPPRYTSAKLLLMMVEIFLSHDILHQARVSKVPGALTREKSGKSLGKQGWVGF